ncbi:MAG: DNA repair protein RecN [Ruminococcaceae bacterium]|nr:DNA repair protein RecN [Oscillospiraceae bacterium]
MLKSLSISNVAVIKEAVIDFESGLNVLTGETGAGKSIIIDSLNLITGNRASKDIVRTGEKSARVEALFDIDDAMINTLSELGIDASDGELLISREVSVEGKNNIRINGGLSTLAILGKIGRELINIHGQNENQELYNSDKHIKLLDNFAGCGELLEEYRAEFRDAKRISDEIKALDTDEYEKERKLELLNYEIELIENTNLKEGEYEELLEKRKIIANGKKISDNLSSAYDLIKKGYGHPSCDEQLSDAMKEIGEIASFDKGIEEIHTKITDAYYALEDVSEALRDYMNSFSFNEYEIDEIEKRIDEINELRRRFGKDYETVMAYLDKIKREAEDIILSDERILMFKKELEAKKEKLLKLSTKLTEKRKQAAEILKKDVMTHLNELNMKNALFEVLVTKEDKFTKDGVDKVEFLLSANAGMEAGKLNKIASGGELSRIMLGINCALLKTNTVPTVIYDEIDTGVSGRAAQKIAEKLWYVSGDRQVLCVTHLAQIASMADTHFLIEKQVEENTTHTKVIKMQREMRINELARIIGGAVITENTGKSAEDMLNQAEKYKKGETL